MAVTTFFARLSPIGQRHVVSIVVSSNQVVLGYHDANGQTQIETQQVEKGDPWRCAVDLIARHEITKSDVQVVLGHGLYQSLLIDDPGLSANDKRAGLPFKLKDFIADSPSEVVADGFSLPFASRFQAFVCRKAPLIQLSQTLAKLQCRLTQVSVEDVALRQWTQLDKTEMVLSRDCHDVIQLAAFHQGKLCFQRQIRGVLLDGSLLPPLLLDELALEIQRSLDYLRSQLKATPVSALVVSVEGCDDTELAFQLSSRLSVTVRPQALFSEGDHRQHIAVLALSPDTSPDVNLFYADLAPRTPWLTFEKMLTVWGVSAMLLVLVAAYQQWQLSQSSQALVVVNSERKSAEVLSDELNMQLMRHVPSLTMANMIAETEAEIAAKREALNAVKQHDIALQQGYAETFKALAALSRRDVSVSEIAVGVDGMDIKGLASDPAAVPSWLKTFATEPSLAGRVFEKMTLARDEKQRLHFELVSRRKTTEVQP